MRTSSLTALCIIYFCCIEYFCTTKGISLWCTPPHQPPSPLLPRSHSAVLRSAAKPSGKFPPCFSLGATAWCRNRSKSYFSWGNCKWSARLKKRFHLSPNEAFTDPVSKLRCNKLLPANINEICSLIAKTSRPQHDCFSRSGARRTLVSIFFFMQQEQIGTAGSIGDGSFEIKTWDFSQKMERQVGSLDCSAVWFLWTAPSSLSCFFENKTFIHYLPPIHHPFTRKTRQTWINKKINKDTNVRSSLGRVVTSGS